MPRQSRRLRRSAQRESPTAIGDERSLVPYERVFGNYRDAAYEALSDGYIPLGYKAFHSRLLLVAGAVSTAG